MPDYSRGKIYKITAGELTYIGSTCEPTLARRLSGHVGKCKQWKKGTYQFTSSFPLIETGQYEITLIELCPCVSRDELNSRERYWIESTVCVNKNIAGRTLKEYREANADMLHEKDKVYYKANADTICERHKAYNEVNADMIRKRKKAYNEANKDTIREKNKAYNAANTDTIRQKNKAYRLANRDEINKRQREARAKIKSEANA